MPRSGSAPRRTPEPRRRSRQAALAAGPLLRGLLFGLSPAALVSVIAAPVALALVALAAGFPSLRHE